MIKLPGTGQYFYADGAKEEYVQSSYSVQGNGGALINTLSSSFQHSYVLYNDETPDGECSSKPCSGYVLTSDAAYALVQISSRLWTGTQKAWWRWMITWMAFGWFTPCPSSPPKSVAFCSRTRTPVLHTGSRFCACRCNPRRLRPWQTLCTITDPRYVFVWLFEWARHVFGAHSVVCDGSQIYNVSLSSTVQAQLPYLTNVCLNKEYDSEATYGQGKLTTTDAREFTVFSKTAKWVRWEGCARGLVVTRASRVDSPCSCVRVRICTTLWCPRTMVQTRTRKPG
jgi:hypothetical protein